MDREKLEHAQSVLSDPSVTRKLDEMAKAIKREKEPDKSEHKRRKGRPKDGRLRIGITLIKALPEVGYCPAIAQALRVERQTVIQWTQYAVNPLPCVEEGRKRLFRKKDVVKFLIATRRYKPKPEYGDV